MVVAAVGAGHVAARGHRGVVERGDLGRGAEEAGRPRQLLRVRRAEPLAQRVGELDVVDLVVAADEDHEQAARVGHHRIRLEKVPGRDAERAGYRVDRGLAGRVELADELERGHGLGLGAGDFDVRRIAGRERDVVLAGGARRHVLVRAEPAHHPDVALDPVDAQARALHDAVVGAHVQRVALLERGLVAVEAV